MITKTQFIRRRGLSPQLTLGLIAGVMLTGIAINYFTRAATTSTLRELPSPLYGVTADDVSSTSNLVAAAEHFAKKPITRIVFDEGTTPADYTAAVNQLQPSSYLMGELADSQYLAAMSTQQYHDRTANFLAAFGDKLDLWEIGNEVNGDWTGPYATVSAKITDAYNQVSAAGRRSSLTLWYNPNCAGSTSELGPVEFSQNYVPATMRTGLNYVFISYYETQCNNYRPSAATLTTLFTQLHQLYPNAKLGFGEIGLPNAATSSTLAKATDIATYYYNLSINLSYYVGGYFYWYYAEDAIPYTTKPMWQTLNNLFQTMPVPGTSRTGDVNHDGTVNVFDLSTLLSKWQTTDPATDINHDGTVNIFDLSLVLSNWG
jgi:hypothetical protein